MANNDDLGIKDETLDDDTDTYTEDEDVEEMGEDPGLTGNLGGRTRSEVEEDTDSDSFLDDLDMDMGEDEDYQ